MNEVFIKNISIQWSHFLKYCNQNIVYDCNVPNQKSKSNRQFQAAMSDVTGPELAIRVHSLRLKCEERLFLNGSSKTDQKDGITFSVVTSLCKKTAYDLLNMQ